jgi:hypothetical protein
MASDNSAMPAPHNVEVRCRRRAETAPMRMESPSVEPRLTGLLGSIANTASEPAAFTRCDGSTPISELLPAPGRLVTPMR